MSPKRRTSIFVAGVATALAGSMLSPAAGASATQSAGASAAQADGVKTSAKRPRCTMTVRMEPRNKAHPKAAMARTRVKCNFKSPRIRAKVTFIRKPGKNSANVKVVRNRRKAAVRTYLGCSKKVRTYSARGYARVAPPKRVSGNVKTIVKRTGKSRGVC